MMILHALLLSSLALHAVAQDATTAPASLRLWVAVTDSDDVFDDDTNNVTESPSAVPDDLVTSEGSGEDFNVGNVDKQWDDAEKEIGMEVARRKRQTMEQQQQPEVPAMQPAEAMQEVQAVQVLQAPPQVLAQRGHGRDSDEREDRHRPSCRTVKCTSGTECIIENGRPTCRPTRPQPSRSCRDISCPRGSKCRMERDPRCRDRFCSEQPVCVRDSQPSCSNVQCPAGFRCRIVEEQGCRGRDCREVVTCVPGGGNPCDGIRCPFGTSCQWNGRQPTCTPIVIDKCLNARCPPGFQCRMTDNQPRCFPATTPSCRPNEVWAQCASPCEPSCGNASPLICPARCDPPKCQCAPGFWRHQSGSCVQQHQCRFFG